MFSYRCYTARRKGSACCTNTRPAPMADTDDAILAAVETELPDPCVVRKALQYAEEAILRDTGAERHEVLAAELKEVKAAIRRLTMAIAAIP